MMVDLAMMIWMHLCIQALSVPLIAHTHAVVPLSGHILSTAYLHLRIAPSGMGSKPKFNRSWHSQRLIYRCSIGDSEELMWCKATITKVRSKGDAWTHNILFIEVSVSPQLAASPPRLSVSVCYSRAGGLGAVSQLATNSSTPKFCGGVKRSKPNGPMVLRNTGTCWICMGK